MNSNLETQLRQSKYSRRGSTAIINQELFQEKEVIDEDTPYDFTLNSKEDYPQSDRQSTSNYLKAAKVCKKCSKNIDPVFNQLVVEEKVNKEMK